MRKLGKQEAGRIVRTLEERIATLEDPRSLGARLPGSIAAIGGGGAATIA